VVRRADDDVGETVAVLVAGARDLAAEVVARALAADLEQGLAVHTREHEGRPGSVCAARARDLVRHAVAVHVARALDPDPELVARLAVALKAQLPGRARVHVDTSRGGSADGLERSGEEQVVHAVAVRVAGVASDPAEAVTRGLAVERDQDLELLDEGRRGADGEEGREACIAAEGGQVRVRLEELEVRVSLPPWIMPTLKISRLPLI
jgi:hypothetical protein